MQPDYDVPLIHRIMVFGDEKQSVTQVAELFYETSIRKPIAVLQGGYEAFSTKFPFLCTDWHAERTQIVSMHYCPSQVLEDSTLFLGGQESRNACYLELFKITHVVSMVEEPWEEAARKECSGVSGHLWFPVQDLKTQNLRQFFTEAFQFIDEARASGGRVLVHCQAGLSRSPTLVAAWLMHVNSWCAAKALCHLQSIRNIMPNQGFLGQLMEFEETEGFHSLEKVNEIIKVPIWG